MTGLRLLPPLAWTALIAWMSTSVFSAPATESALLPLLRALLPWLVPEQLAAIHWLIRKAGHVIEYGVLALLWDWALRGWRPALLLAILTAMLDELHQALAPAREGSVLDVLLDALGAGTALFLHRGAVRAALDRLTGILLWIAAGGGTALLALHATAGAPLGWLWLTVPGGWIALVLWRWRLRR